MVQADRICFEDVVAIHGGGINVLDKYAGVERGVVKVADGEGYGIFGRWQETEALAQKMLSEGHLCGEAKVEATVPASAAGGLAAAPASEAWGVGAGAIVVA
jgi:hypothetical protein